MKLSDFYYELPHELIAQTPLDDRASSRMMIMNRKTGELRHGCFKDIDSLLRPGDCLVLNESKVIPARLFGIKDSTNAKIELLLLKRTNERVWETIARPGKKLRAGDRITFKAGVLSAVVLETLPDGGKIIEFDYSGIFEEILDRLGEMPLPPYITAALGDKTRYQTVYAKHDGSAAAPTAGLHFTNEIIDRLESRGVIFAGLTLHVGLGTFRPVKSIDISRHVMHSEYYNLDEANCRIINDAKKNGGRIIAVGTTSCRVLETISAGGTLRPSSGNTDIFIYPGYDFKITDGLLTNFHLPESTLVMLVSAFSTREGVLTAYAEAVREKYRFFSFGDCMIII